MELHHYAKFHRNRSKRGRDMVFFLIFQDGGRRHLEFLKFRIFLTVGRVTSVKLRQRAKFRRNRSNRGRDMRVSILC